MTRPYICQGVKYCLKNWLGFQAFVVVFSKITANYLLSSGKYYLIYDSIVSFLQENT